MQKAIEKAIEQGATHQDNYYVYKEKDGKVSNAPIRSDGIGTWREFEGSLKPHIEAGLITPIIKQQPKPNLSELARKLYNEWVHEWNRPSYTFVDNHDNYEERERKIALVQWVCERLLSEQPPAKADRVTENGGWKTISFEDVHLAVSRDKEKRQAERASSSEDSSRIMKVSAPIQLTEEIVKAIFPEVPRRPNIFVRILKGAFTKPKE